MHDLARKAIAAIPIELFADFVEWAHDLGCHDYEWEQINGAAAAIAREHHFQGPLFYALASDDIRDAYHFYQGDFNDYLRGVALAYADITWDWWERLEDEKRENPCDIYEYARQWCLNNLESEDASAGLV